MDALHELADLQLDVRVWTSQYHRLQAATLSTPLDRAVATQLVLADMRRSCLVNPVPCFRWLASKVPHVLLSSRGCLSFVANSIRRLSASAYCPVQSQQHCRAAHKVGTVVSCVWVRSCACSMPPQA